MSTEINTILLNNITSEGEYDAILEKCDITAFNDKEEIIFKASTFSGIRGKAKKKLIFKNNQFVIK